MEASRYLEANKKGSKDCWALLHLASRQGCVGGMLLMPPAEGHDWQSHLSTSVN